jgi:multimeric flavodoxin WrbA
MSDRECDAAVVFASSRNHGNTRLLVEYVVATRAVPVIDLLSKRIGVYDYSHANIGDDFIPLVEALSQKALWVFATPVYWYTMSAQLKTFVDRLTDMVTIRKDIGRNLRGRSVAVIASGTDAGLPAGFESPFRLTCDYLGMTYQGAFYGQFDRDLVPSATTVSKAGAYGAALFEMTANQSHNADARREEPRAG